MPRKQCKACDVFFIAFRSDALTCSPRCRQRYKRMCDQITRLMAIQALPKKVPVGVPRSCSRCGLPRNGLMGTVCVECAHAIAGGALP